MITATTPLRRTPVWAVLQRRLFAVLDRAWREFEQTYCEPDGRLTYAGKMHHRDGVDDFYEPFFNWPTLYRLGGADDLIVAAKHHWAGVTAQMTEFGFVRDEYELGYDWFHQGESLNFFYALCAADPDDAAFRARAKRFARLYSDPAAGNYDPAARIIVAPHTGSGGPRWGLGTEWIDYSASQTGMRPYGLPLDDLDGIDEWDDLASAANARRMGDAMQTRLGRGDTAVNLAATSLVTNAWLYDNEPEFSSWVTEYVSAWRERASANGGLIPDNVGPNGAVGELHNGRWFGGHYGWAWPHGLHSVEAAAMIAAINETIVTGGVTGLDLARVPLDTVIANGNGSEVPFRHGASGWFDFQPLPLVYPVWLWWLTSAPADVRRLESLARSDWSETKWFHDKEEQGHEAPWISYLLGRNPLYPEHALELALGQVDHRLALMRATPFGPPDDNIHWWQRLNPVVTEVLTQLTTGAPPALYNGGLALARVTYGDARRGRPGLPADVAALVSEADADGIRTTLVNLSPDDTREVVVQAGAFGEDRIDDVQFDVAADYPGDPGTYAIPLPASSVRSQPVGRARLVVELPPLTRVSLRLSITRRARTPAHRSFSAPHQS
ncbi:hypothetical protein [Kutzneria sp. CA-103260]|uniref:hypothetical protein n=1 Tax=Kutzneria sp. CA-103260 TaxID=2802641 RepID=UPI001BED590C|nr:hypothetical protein [Kutzneria sp. CA-103260]QUQ72474.1 hypothetical protein JJ691_102630 [Kutzneria sp. CA-103260]